MIRAVPYFTRVPLEPPDEVVNAVLRLVVKDFPVRCTSSVDAYLTLHGDVFSAVILPASGPLVRARIQRSPEEVLLSFGEIEFASQDEVRQAAADNPALFGRLIVSISIDLVLSDEVTPIVGRVVTEQGEAPFSVTDTSYSELG